MVVMQTIVVDSAVPVSDDRFLRAATWARILFRNVDYTRYLAALRYVPFVVEAGTTDEAVRALNDGAGWVLASGSERLDVPEGRTVSEEELGRKYDLDLQPPAPVVTSDRPDGLVPTVVCDEHGVALGLSYSSKESLEVAISRRRGVYHSRKRGLWVKGETSGDVQELLRVDVDCDNDTLRFIVRQHGRGFCHEGRGKCFQTDRNFSLSRLEKVLRERKECPVEGSYTQRLLNDSKLLRSKILEEAKELTEAKSRQEVAWEAADLLYFALAKMASEGVTLSEVENELGRRNRKVTRRPGDAKPPVEEDLPPPHFTIETQVTLAGFEWKKLDSKGRGKVLQRPIFDPRTIYKKVEPILEQVHEHGDAALRHLTARFDGVNLDSVVLQGPVECPMDVPADTKKAIDQAWDNIYAFHQKQTPKCYEVQTVPGVSCERVWRPIESVGLYVPGGNNILPSTALMLGIPAVIAGCKDITIATPPDSRGSVSRELLYIAHRLGAARILLAGGAQAVAAMAYGTESVPKCDKICGPGNQYVTAAKMLVQNDTSACTSIDMPAGPSEVMVIADGSANPTYVSADLLSQAEHGSDSQVILLALSDFDLDGLRRAMAEHLDLLQSRRPILDVSLTKARIIRVDDIDTAITVANHYASEHLIINTTNAPQLKHRINHAGSVFIGPFAAETCGDYASGTNHTLPTYGFARVYAGVSVDTFVRGMTVQTLSEEGLKCIGQTVMTLASVEGLEAHRLAVQVRIDDIFSKKEA